MKFFKKNKPEMLRHDEIVPIEGIPFDAPAEVRRKYSPTPFESRLLKTLGDKALEPLFNIMPSYSLSSTALFDPMPFIKISWDDKSQEFVARIPQDQRSSFVVGRELFEYRIDQIFHIAKSNLESNTSLCETLKTIMGLVIT